MSNDLPDIFDGENGGIGGTTDGVTETMTNATEQTDDSTDSEPQDTGGMTGPQDEAFDPLELYDLNRHRVNGDVTAVILSSLGRGFQAIAVDVDKAGEVLATEEIGDAADRESAESMCEYWVRQHPKGILGGEEGDGESGGGGGMLAKLLGGGDS